MAMKLELKSKPKNPIILEGFPGFGFVSTITTEYIAEHLDVVSIGKIWSEDLTPMAVIHGKKIVQPMEIFYSKKYNLVLLEALSGVKNLEWAIVDALLLLYKELQAKEIISIEGIASPMMGAEPKAYYWTTSDARAKDFDAAKAIPLKDGIILGVSGALMLKLKPEVNASFIFAEASSELPDSKAAARIVEVLDKLLRLKIDPKPLLARAKEFEKKLQGLLQQQKQAKSEHKKKEIAPYVG